VIFEPSAAGLEYPIEDIAHGEDGGACINRLAIHLDPARLSANLCFFFYNGDIIAARGELGCAGKAAHSCSDNDDLVALHAPPVTSPPWLSRAISGRVST